MPLQRPSTHRRLAWLVLLAVLASALLPTLAHALGAGSAGTAWAEVCTAQGVKYVPVVAPQASAPGDVDAGGNAEQPRLSLNGAMDHCPWCTLSQAVDLAPPPDVLVLVLAPPGPWLPERFFTAASTPPVWRAAQPRAPPSQG